MQTAFRSKRRIDREAAVWSRPARDARALLHVALATLSAPASFDRLGGAGKRCSQISRHVPRVRVSRDDKPFPDRLRSYRVVLDGDTVGRVKRGETVTVQADVGQHELHLAIDWARSPSIELELAEDDERIIRCWPNAKPLLALYFMTFGRRRWIGIDLVHDGSGQP